MIARRGVCMVSGLALLAVLALPPVRTAMEAGMATHMLLQYPALALAGVLLAAGLPAGVRASLDAWNEQGLSGLLFVALALAILMIPRVLDLALVDGRVEALKWLALLACGVACAVSWRRAGLIVQGFFLGNVLPMTAVAGTLYMEAPQRLCNAYLVDEQQQVGYALVMLAVAVAAVWLARVGWLLCDGSAPRSRRRSPAAF